MLIYKRCYFIFIIGGIGYSLLEILWRGYTHPSMAIAGGLCLIGIYYVSCTRIKSRTLRAMLCTLLITATELIFGIIVNRLLKLNVWDYSALPLNFMGQICVIYSLLWFLLSFVLMTIFEGLKQKIVKN